MLQYTENFALLNSQSDKQPRYVVEIAFDAAATDLVYFTNHADCDYPSGKTVYLASVQGLSGTTQKLNPLEANSSIGNLSVEIVDGDGNITALLSAKTSAGYGPRGKRLRIYAGYYGLSWSDYHLLPGGTQIIDEIAFDASPGSQSATYVISTSDIQRTTRKDIFDLAKTNITSSVPGPGETGYSATGATINVGNTDQFSTIARGTSYSYNPSTTIGYFRIDDEIISYTGKTATTFTGCVRGALGTEPAPHNISSGAEASRQPQVIEVVYYEMPAPKLAYALLTGVLYNQGGATIPSGHHLNIDTQYIDDASFLTAFPDLYLYTDDTKGFPVRFIGLDKQDAKKFIETELLLPMGCYLAVKNTGELSLRRMARVLTNSGYVALLDETNVVSYNELHYDMKSMTNSVIVNWNYEDRFKTTTRKTAVIDANSIATHGASAPYSVTFKGIYGNKYNDAAIGAIFDGIIDRYSNPPYGLSVTAMPSMNFLEVGDHVRVHLPNLRDLVSGTSLDRVFEIQQARVDWITGAVQYDLFGSSAAGKAVAHTTNSSDLNDAWYTSAGTSVTSPISADTTWDGSAGKIVKYCNGDLTINSGVTVTIKGDVELRVKGLLTLNGKIDGVGQGKAGAGAGGTMGSAGTPGYFSNIGGGGVSISLQYANGDFFVSGSVTRPTVGTRETADYINLINNNGTLNGLESYSFQGSGGGSGSGVQRLYSAGSPYTLIANGGSGGKGGAGLAIIARGFAKGAGAIIDLSGSPGAYGGVTGAITVGSKQFYFYGGSGAGGSPGVLFCALDGNSVNVPDHTWLRAYNGRSPIPPGNEIPYAGTRLSNIDVGDYHSVGAIYDATKQENYADAVGPSAFRFQRIPDNTAKEADVSPIAPVAAIASVVESSNTPQTPAENLATLTVTVTPPGAANYSHSNIYYRVNGSGKPYQLAGGAKNTWAIVAPMDGVTYDILAKPVSISGVESDAGVSTTKTMTNAKGGVTLQSGNYIAIAKTSYADTTAGAWIGNDGGTPKLNIGNATYWMKWTGTALEMAGDVASSGRVRATSGSNYVEIDGTNGIRGYDSVLGYTFKIPLDGSAPTFSGGVISSTTFNLYTSSVIRTSSTVGGGGASDYGVLMNSAGVKGFKANDSTPVFFLDASDGSFTFGQISTNKYLDFDASTGDVTLGKDTKFIGSDAYSNDSIYFRSYFESLDRFGTANTSGDVNVANSCLAVTTGNTTPSFAYANFRMVSAITAPSWSKIRRFKAKINFTSFATGVAGEIYLVCGWEGSSTYAFGFKFAGDGTNRKMYGYSAGGSGETATALQNFSLSTYYEVEAVFTPSTDVKVYVDGSLLATITTNLPSGTSGYEQYIFRCHAVNITGVQHQINVYEYKFQQDE